MEKLSQEYILSILFVHSLEKEELLIKKYEGYCKSIKDADLKELLKDYKNCSREHIKLLKDKMIKLKIQGST